MFKKAVSATLLLALVFALTPAAGASNPPDLAVPEAGYPTEVQQTGEPFLSATNGGTNWSCVGAVLGFSLFALGAGAGTGGVGLAVVGAYAPLALVFCK
ncbi:MAG: hypothetical protein OYL92_14500 [Acidobacteriota bacterium]|nr:hypothetical protein [Acidobacteriota bacterium]MDE2922994.1 hypothetical protein [Acidobacteriota bacterium]MDE3266173.1 hypothetical protein [Acidobacteriota bacterium]